MILVYPEDVLRKFKDYIKEYGDMLSADQAIEELEDALDSAKYEELE